MVNPNQLLQFPRKNTFLAVVNVDNIEENPEDAQISSTIFFEEQTTADVTIPQDILDACCEIAIALLDGIDVDKEAQNLSITEHHFMVARSKRDTTFAQ